METSVHRANKYIYSLYISRQGWQVIHGLYKGKMGRVLLLLGHSAASTRFSHCWQNVRLCMATCR